MDTTIVAPRSTQAAATSKAASTAVPLKIILKTAWWRSSTFAAFYIKPIVKQGVVGQAVLAKGVGFQIS